MNSIIMAAAICTVIRIGDATVCFPTTDQEPPSFNINDDGSELNPALAADTPEQDWNFAPLPQQPE